MEKCLIPQWGQPKWNKLKRQGLRCLNFYVVASFSCTSEISIGFSTENLLFLSVGCRVVWVSIPLCLCRTYPNGFLFTVLCTNFYSPVTVASNSNSYAWPVGLIIDLVPSLRYQATVILVRGLTW